MKHTGWYTNPMCQGLKRKVTFVMWTLLRSDDFIVNTWEQKKKRWVKIGVLYDNTRNRW
jgi:hypothetical protein